MRIVAVGAAVVVELALLAQLADGDELGDPPLDVVEAGVVGVQHLAGVAGSSRSSERLLHGTAISQSR